MSKSRFHQPPDPEYQLPLFEDCRLGKMPTAEEVAFSAKLDENRRKLAGAASCDAEVTLPNWLVKAKGWKKTEGNKYVGVIKRVTQMSILFRLSAGVAFEEWLPLSRIELRVIRRHNGEA